MRKAIVRGSKLWLRKFDWKTVSGPFIGGWKDYSFEIWWRWASVAVLEGVDKWVEERSRGRGSGCMRQSICKTYGPNMREIWTRCSVAMLMDAKPRILYLICPPRRICLSWLKADCDYHVKF